MSLDPTDLAKLMAWLSPAFPVGGYTYSHGLEWAIEDGTVATAGDLARWLDDILAHGAGRNDAILLRAGHHAATHADPDALFDGLEIGLAFHPSRERWLEATAQGSAFLKAIGDVYPHPALATLIAAVSARRERLAIDPAQALPWPYPLAVGLAAGCHAIPVDPALATYLQAFAANVVSAGVRAVPLGQTDGLRLVAGAQPRIAALVLASRSTTLDDLGGAVLRADIASMRHETQYTRLFRS
jgi:urease accessory protein